MSEFLLTQVINYGAPLLGMIVFIGGLGIPLPCTLLVIAAGAFAREGIIPWPTTAFISIISVVTGDSISYSLGYYSRDLVLKRFSGSPRWLQAERSFQKWGPLSIFFSRFLVTAIALPVNLLSGTTRFPFKKFLVYDLLGEVVWIFGYGGLGYWFGSEWELVSDFISNFGGLILGLLIFGFGIRQAWSWQEKKKMLPN
ncbi:MAG TPA: DedA family protein [Anaerolineales bacterium]|nr:DedA family protein [Anaerolineales bacterium]